MLFWFTKFLTQLVYPLDSGLLLMVVGLCGFALGWRRWAGTCLVTGTLWLWLWSMPLASIVLRGSLEQRYPPVAVTDLPQADAIVVLGGVIEGRQPPRLEPDLGAPADRVWHAARLYLAGKAPRIVISGGNIPGQDQPESEAEVMAEFLRALGVPPTALILEPRSINTRTNAACSKSLLDQLGLRRILLVTSALHMPRAMQTFRAYGVEVIPAATDYEAVHRHRSIFALLPDALTLDGSGRAIKEYAGLVAFGVMGAGKLAECPEE